jgi:hypothetical protein
MISLCQDRHECTKFPIVLVFIISGEFTKKLVSTLSHDPIWVNLLVCTSAIKFRPMLSIQCFRNVASTSAATLPPVGPMFNIIGSNVDISTPFANEYLGSTQHHTHPTGEIFTFSSSSPKMKFSKKH